MNLTEAILTLKKPGARIYGPAGGPWHMAYNDGNFTPTSPLRKQTVKTLVDSELVKVQKTTPQGITYYVKA